MVTKLAIGSIVFSGLYFNYKKQSLPVAEGEPYKLLPKVPFSENPNKHFLSREPIKIGVVGTGVSGLAVAKELKIQGYEVEVLEKNSEVGGVWFKNYPEVGLQAHYSHYEYPDFSFPEDYPKLPDLFQVQSWMKSYAEHFGIYDLIQFNTEVNSIHQSEDGSWNLLTSKGEKQYDFLVVCGGVFNKPYIPELPSRELFKKEVVHSSKIEDYEKLFRGKKVVVIGAQKSAEEISQKAVKYGGEVVSVMRKAHVQVQHSDTLLGLPATVWLLNKFAEFLIPPYDNNKSSFIQNYCKFISHLYLNHFKSFQKNWPEDLKFQGNVEDVFPCQGLITDSEYFDHLKNGRLKLVVGSPSEFTEKGIIVNNREIETDVIVFATGFIPNYLGTNLDGNAIWLYRSAIVPGMTNIAFIGYVSTLSIPTLSSIQAIWLCEVLRGALKLPSEDEMKRDVEIRKKRFRKAFGDLRGIENIWFIMPMISTVLLEDMKIQTKRTPSVKQEWIVPRVPKDYKLVVTHRV